MKKLLLVLVLLCSIIAACGEVEPTAAPQPTADIAATVQAEVQKALESQSTPTALPTYTPLPTLTPQPTYTSPPEPTDAPVASAATNTPIPSSSTSPPPPSGDVPSGEWTVRSYNTDDAAVVFVDGQMVGGSVYGHDSDWININDHLAPGQDTIVAFASYNGRKGGSWGFSVRRDDVALWGSEESTGDTWTLNYAQQVAIHPDGSVESLPPDLSARMPPAGEWYVRAQNVQDVGGILVNGQPVAVNWSNVEAGWVEITGLLYSDRDNTVTFAAWNFEGEYSWDFAIKHDEVIIWGKQGTGSGAGERVFQESVTISSQGEILQTLPSGAADDYVWAIRSYNTDDAAVAYVDGQMVGGSVYGHDSDWININDHLVPDQDTIAAFASYNGRKGGSWGFNIRRDDIIVWGSEESTGDTWTLNYAQQVAIHPDGSVESLPPDVSARMPPAGEWYVRAQNVQDVGGILANGQPVAVNWSNVEADWVEITGMLYSDRDNTVTFSAWNFEGEYSWDFGIKHDEEIVWAVSNTGSGQTGLVLLQDVIVTGNGKIQQ